MEAQADFWMDWTTYVLVALVILMRVISRVELLTMAWVIAFILPAFLLACFEGREEFDVCMYVCLQ